MVNPKHPEQQVLSDQEIEWMVSRADEVCHGKFFVLRAKAAVTLLKFGNRRGELLALSQDDLKRQADGSVKVQFSLFKKRKPKEQFIINDFSGDDAKRIVEYSDYLRQIRPECFWLFPRTQSIFGTQFKIDVPRNADGSVKTDREMKLYIHTYVDKDKFTKKGVLTHRARKNKDGTPFINRSIERRGIGVMSGCEMLHIIKSLNQKSWVHLFRDSYAADIVKESEEQNKGKASLETVFQVQTALNLENPQTALGYTKRFMTRKRPDKKT